MTALFILQNFGALKKYKRAAIKVGSSHPTLYVNKRRTKKLYKLYTKPYILFVIFVIISALRSVWFVFQTLHKLYTKPYTVTTKPYTESQRDKESKRQRVKETKRERVEEREGGA